jgi:ribonuclease J
MSGPTVRFLGGVREIGGNKLVVEDGPDRVLFDFGPSFSPRRRMYYLNFLQPRSTSPVKDLLEFDLVPRVDGLYSEEALQGSSLRPSEPEFHAVFVSHAHWDHAGHLDLIDPQIPVYTSTGTKSLLDAIESSTSQRYGSHPWRLFSPGDRIRIGNLEVVPYPVDHSIPSAHGFLIHTREATLAYTGDLRTHGPRGQDTHDFVDAIRDARPQALVIEGTRVGPESRRTFTEAGVGTEVQHLLARTQGPAFVSCYPRDVDRLKTLYAAAQTAEREFVVSLRTAHLLTELARAGVAPEVPTPGHTSGLRVYARSKKTYYKWERPFLDDAVDAEYVRRHHRDILLSIDLAHFGELIDLQPPAGAPFIRSMSEPFSEVDLDDQVLHNWLDHFGLPLHQLHASGHCSAAEIAHMVERARVATIFPVHTEHPESFPRGSGRVQSPELGVPYSLSG